MICLWNKVNFLQIHDEQWRHWNIICEEFVFIDAFVFYRCQLFVKSFQLKNNGK